MTDDVAGVNGRSMPPQVLRAESDSAAVDEVVLATGLPQWQVERRLDLAVDADGRGQLLTAALAEGRVSLDRAIRLHHDTRGLGTEETHAICQRLLAPNRDGSIRTDRSFRRELRRQWRYTRRTRRRRETTRWPSGARTRRWTRAARVA